MKSLLFFLCCALFCSHGEGYFRVSRVPGLSECIEEKKRLTPGESSLIELTKGPLTSPGSEGVHYLSEAEALSVCQSVKLVYHVGYNSEKEFFYKENLKLIYQYWTVEPHLLKEIHVYEGPSVIEYSEALNGYKLWVSSDEESYNFEFDEFLTEVSASNQVLRGLNLGGIGLFSSSLNFFEMSALKALYQKNSFLHQGGIISRVLKDDDPETEKTYFNFTETGIDLVLATDAQRFDSHKLFEDVDFEVSSETFEEFEVSLANSSVSIKIAALILSVIKKQDSPGIISNVRKIQTISGDSRVLLKDHDGVMILDIGENVDPAGSVEPIVKTLNSPGLLIREIVFSSSSINFEILNLERREFRLSLSGQLTKYVDQNRASLLEFLDFMKENEFLFEILGGVFSWSLVQKTPVLIKVFNEWPPGAVPKIIFIDDSSERSEGLVFNEQGEIVEFRVSSNSEINQRAYADKLTSVLREGAPKIKRYLESKIIKYDGAVIPIQNLDLLHELHFYLFGEGAHGRVTEVIFTDEYSHKVSYDPDLSAFRVYLGKSDFLDSISHAFGFEFVSLVKFFSEKKIELPDEISSSLFVKLKVVKEQWVDEVVLRKIEESREDEHRIEDEVLYISARADLEWYNELALTYKMRLQQEAREKANRSWWDALFDW